MTPRIEPYGPNALLVRFSNQGDEEAFGRTQDLLRHLEQHPPQGLLEVTPGFTTVLLEFHKGTRPDPSEWAALLQDVLDRAPDSNPAVRILEIPVLYDGPDLGRVAAHGAMGVRDVIRLHAAVTYRVQILGFSPGFPYLTGLDPRLHVPRLATPRPQVPAGSVAIGGEHTGIYPVATAGGWNLIGRTDVILMDPERAARNEVESFLLRPGDVVRFIPVSELGSPAASAHAVEGSGPFGVRTAEATNRPANP